MRVPKRRSEALLASKAVPQDHYLTPASIERLKRDLDDLKRRQRPEAVAETRRTAEMGDFSENFAYQHAKSQLRRINARILSIEERIKNAIPIDSASDTSGQIRIGSKVVVSADGRKMTFEILGSQETSPGRGRISYLSPLGKALIGHKKGEQVVVAGQEREVTYQIENIL